MIMCEVESLANTYLNNLNSTARKFSRDIDNFRSSFGTKWSEFPEEKKDELVDKFVVGSEVRNKYKDFPRTDNVEECFPVLKIKSGEKIVVDFDNEDVSIAKLAKRLKTVKSQMKMAKLIKLHI